MREGGYNRMKIRSTVIGCTVGLVAALFMAFPASAYTDMQTERNYTYNQNGEAVYIPDAYEYAGAAILADDAGVAVQNPQDFYIAKNGNIYIADTDNSRILILDPTYKYVAQVSKITAPDGTVSHLNKPEGV